MQGMRSLISTSRVGNALGRTAIGNFIRGNFNHGVWSERPGQEPSHRPAEDRAGVQERAGYALQGCASRGTAHDELPQEQCAAVVAGVLDCCELDAVGPSA